MDGESALRLLQLVLTVRQAGRPGPSPDHLSQPAQPYLPSARLVCMRHALNDNVPRALTGTERTRQLQPSLLHMCMVHNARQMHEQCSSDRLCTERHRLKCVGEQVGARLAAMLLLVTADAKHSALAPICWMSSEVGASARTSSQARQSPCTIQAATPCGHD